MCVPTAGTAGARVSVALLYTCAPLAFSAKFPANVKVTFKARISPRRSRAPWKFRLPGHVDTCDI